MVKNITNYRIGSYYTIPANTLTLIIAYFADAPIMALLSIGICGYSVSLVLFLLGKRSIST